MAHKGWIKKWGGRERHLRPCGKRAFWSGERMGWRDLLRRFLG